MKKETLEEVAETELYITINKIIDGGKNLIKGTNVSRGQAVDYAFDIALKIAKWQAERMYSEEEVIKSFDNLGFKQITSEELNAKEYQPFITDEDGNIWVIDKEHWFEQSKKK
jgi:uncharacterized protein (DUF433 family)